jgi:hypothetical protein
MIVADPQRTWGSCCGSHNDRWFVVLQSTAERQTESILTIRRAGRVAIVRQYKDWLRRLDG